MPPSQKTISLQSENIRQNPMYLYLTVLTIGSTIGLQAWTMLFNNFAVEVAGLDGDSIGVIQSVREIPGFLALLAVFVIRHVKEHRLSALSILCLGLGLAVTGMFPSLAGLTVTTLVMSFGFHCYETTNMSLTLQHFKKKEAPLVFGKLRSFAAASSIVIGVFIFLLSPVLNFTQLYLVIGALIMSCALWGFTQNPADREVIGQHKKMIFRKRYWLYYFITFMAGARRQIFIAFSVLLMVQKFKFSIQEITLLFIFNNTIVYFLSPLIGKGIIRFGERKVLSLEYLSLIFIFLSYAVTDSRLIVAGLYILDHIFFNFSMAVSTFFQKMGDPADIAPTMAVGFTINHIAAVFLPAIGGLLWMVDYRIPFFAGAFLSLVSLLAVQKIQT